jgi:hypothetical protein
MAELMLSLLTWLGSHTAHRVDLPLPNLVLAEPYQLCVRYGERDKGRCAATRLRGFYDRHLTIFLHADFDPRSPVDRSRLLHELVHYVQWKNGAHGRCWGELELEAYRLQDAWRAEHGLAPALDPFKAIMLGAACEA